MSTEDGGPIDLKDAVRLLQGKREEPLRLLDAVDKALEALHGVDVPLATPPGPGSATIPTRLAPARTLTDEHKHAMKEGRRRARHAKDVAARLAREPPPGAFSAAPSADVRPPRLVKRPE
jgi:hypothetical protein